MGRILDAAKVYFDGLSWNYRVSDEAEALEFEFAGDHGQWSVVLLERELADQLVVYSFIPIEASQETMHLAYELVARLNFGLPIGCFEISSDTGQIRFRSGIDFDEVDPTSVMIRELVSLNLETTDRYLPSFAQVLVEGIAPADAVARIEREGTPR